MSTERIEFHNCKNSNTESLALRDYYYDMEEYEIICKEIRMDTRDYSEDELKQKYIWAITNYKKEYEAKENLNRSFQN